MFVIRSFSLSLLLLGLLVLFLDFSSTGPVYLEAALESNGHRLNAREEVRDYKAGTTSCQTVCGSGQLITQMPKSVTTVANKVTLPASTACQIYIDFLVS